MTRFVAVEVLLGLQHLQRQRVVYRDLKAANVLVDLDGHCRLADFGLAKRLTGGFSMLSCLCFVRNTSTAGGSVTVRG